MTLDHRWITPCIEILAPGVVALPVQQASPSRAAALRRRSASSTLIRIDGPSSC